MPGRVMRLALAVMVLSMLFAPPARAERVTFRLFEWLTGTDAALHQQETGFFKLDPAHMPFLREVAGGFGLENPGGAPAAIAWSPLDLPQAGLYTLRFEARWDGEGEHGRASAAFGPSRLDFEPDRTWRPYAVSLRQSGPAGPSSVSLSLRARKGRLDVRSVDILRVPFDIRLRADGPRLVLDVIGRAPAESRLAWQSGERRGDTALGDLKWADSGTVASAGLAVPGDDVVRWTLRAADGRLLVAGNPVRRAALPVLPRPSSPVGVREDGVLLVDGKPFFPLGLYLHENTAASIDRAAESGINLALVSPSADNRALVDAARRHGMQIMIEDAVPGDAARVDEGVRDLLGKYGPLPILAWTPVDEPDLKPAYTPTLLQQIRLALAARDGRPVYQSNHSPDTFWTLGTAADILAVDPYPLSQVPKPITTVGQWIDEARAALGPGRSVWLIQQAFVEAPFWPTPPSPEQLRAMTWVGLNHGARGIMYYTVHEVMDPASPPDYRWDLRRTPLWAEIARETREVRALTPFLTHDVPRALPIPGPFDGAAWEDGQGNVLVAIVNVGDKEADAQVTLPWPNVEHLRVWPDGAFIEPAEGRLAARLPGRAVLLLHGQLRQ